MGTILHTFRLGACGLTAMLALGCADRRYEPFAGIRADLAVQQGRRHLADAEIEAALAEFRNAIELNPRLTEAHARIGAICEFKGDDAGAAKAFAEVVRLDPFDFVAAVSLGRAYGKLSRFPDGVRAYLHACDLRPDDYEARLGLGVAYHRGGDLGEALACYQKAIALDPGQAAAYVNLGAVCDARQQYYEAIHAYNEALERNPNQPVVLVNLATTLLKQDRCPHARRALQRAVELDPGFALAHERLGYCLFREAQYETARESYRRAIELDPRMPAAHAGLGVVCMAMYLQQPDRTDLRQQALDGWYRSLDLQPDQPRIRSLVEKYRPQPENPVAAILHVENP